MCSDDTIAPRDVLPLLTALADKSLLSSEDSAGITRLRMLETVCRYASDRLQDTGGSVAWRGRHVAWLVGFVEAAEAGLKRPAQGIWLKRLEAEHDNLRAALRESLASAGKSDAGMRIAAVLWRFWSNRGHASGPGLGAATARRFAREGMPRSDGQGPARRRRHGPH